MESFNHLPEIIARFEDVARQIVAKAALDVESHAKTNHPWHNRTGQTQAAIHAHQAEDPLHWLVETGTDHDLYLEFGTVHMPPFPFMTPAADAIDPSYQAAWRALEERLR